MTSSNTGEPVPAGPADATPTDRLCLLTDAAGRQYLLPAALAEVLRVPDALQGRINDSIDGDVQGFAIGTPNIHETLFLLFRQSIQESNEDKKHYLQKLQSANAAASALSNSLASLSGSLSSIR